MNKSHQKEIENYSKQIILKNEYLINIEFYQHSNYLDKWGDLFGYCSFAGGIIGLFSEMGFMAGMVAGGTLVLYGGILLTPVIFLYETGKYFFRKYNENKKREEKIRFQFKFHFNNLEIEKRKILANMYEIYSTKNNDIKMYKISQENPMKKIYKNIEKFETLENPFKNICLDFKK